MEEKGKILWGEKWEVKRMFLFFLPRATKHWNLSLATKQNVSPLTTKFITSHWSLSKMLPHWPPSMEHSKGHRAWNLPLATKSGFSFTSLLPFLFESTNLDHLFLFSYMIFNLNLWKLVPTTFLGRRKIMNPNKQWKEG